MTTKTIIPTLRYTDPDAALAYLAGTLGLVRGDVTRDDAGGVVHAELFCGDGAVLLGPRRDGDRFDTGRAVLYVVLDDPAAVDDRHDRAVAVGAEIAMAPTDQPYGSREFAALDPEGNVWSFGTYRPVAPVAS